MVEGRTFTVLTDHKPITFAFRQKADKCSPRQFRHLDFISQFTTDIQHISGENNVVADALSRVDEITVPVDFEALATSQQQDQELQRILEEHSTELDLRQICSPGSNSAIYCDIKTSTARPFLTTPFRRTAFDHIHGLAHPGIKATTKLMTQRYVWPSINKDCRTWTRACIPCQQAKVTRHVSAPVGAFAAPSRRFEHVHLDLIIMPYSQGYRYCLTCVDRFSRWPEAIPLQNQEAETVARAFYEHWIARFGVPLRITTDQGRQFESHLFRGLNNLMGTTHLRTTAYHPAANGMVERLHRQLKAAVKCLQANRWTETLPTALLGIRAAWKEDLQSTAAEMVYGQPLRLPGEFLVSRANQEADNAAEFVKGLRQHFDELRPVGGSRHGERKVFIFKDLATATHVFVRHDAPRGPLQLPYDGPYKILSRTDRVFTLLLRGRHIPVTIDRLKPAYIVDDNIQPPAIDSDDEDFTLAPPQQGEVPPPAPAPIPPRQPVVAEPPADQQPPGFRTRSGRRVRFTERYQAGFA